MNSEDEITILDQTLAAYIAEQAVPGTAGRCLGKAGAFTSILTEISQTLLPRHLIFRADGDLTLELDVANRHVMGLSAGSGHVGTTPDHIATTTPGLDFAALDVGSVHAAISRFATTSGPIRVWSLPGTGLAADMSGVSVQKLRNFHPPGPATTSSLIDRFLLGLGPLPKAILQIDEFGTEKTVGDVSALQQLRSGMLADDPCPDLTADQMMIMAEDPQSTTSPVPTAVFIAQLGLEVLMCQLDARDAVHAAGLWITERADRR